MRRLLTLAALLTGFALAQTPDSAGNGNSELPESTIPSATLTCQVAAPSWAGLCFVEKPLYTLGGFAVTVGVEARAAYSGQLDGHLAGYVTLSYQWDRGFAWVDLRTPEVAPAIGTSDALRFGVSIQIGGL